MFFLLPWCCLRLTIGAAVTRSDGWLLPRKRKKHKTKSYPSRPGLGCVIRESGLGVGIVTRYGWESYYRSLYAHTSLWFWAKIMCQWKPVVLYLDNCQSSSASQCPEEEGDCITLCYAYCEAAQWCIEFTFVCHKLGYLFQMDEGKSIVNR